MSRPGDPGEPVFISRFAAQCGRLYIQFTANRRAPHLPKGNLPDWAGGMNEKLDFYWTPKEDKIWQSFKRGRGCRGQPKKQRNNVKQKGLSQSGQLFIHHWLLVFSDVFWPSLTGQSLLLQLLPLSMKSLRDWPELGKKSYHRGSISWPKKKKTHTHTQVNLVALRTC